MSRYKLCKECGQPIKPGRHKPGEYEHASGCPRIRKRAITNSEYQQAEYELAVAIERSQTQQLQKGDKKGE